MLLSPFKYNFLCGQMCVINMHIACLLGVLLLFSNFYMPDFSGFIIIALCVRIQQLATEVN